MKIVNFSIRRPVTTLMIFFAAIIFGLISFNRLRLDLLPDISYPSLTIRTEYPGTAPAEIENLVSKPIEESVGVISGVVRVSSVSRPGVSDVIIEFDWGTNMDFASLDVREKLDLVLLPRDSEQPILLRYDPSLVPIIRAGFFGGENLISLRLFAERSIKQDLESIEGVASVQVNGGLEEEIHVEVNQGKLAALAISMDQIINRLAQENINLTGGTLVEGELEHIVRTLNQFRTIDEINDIIITTKNGANIYLKDIGRAFKSFKERKIITRIDGKESVEISIFKEADANTVNVAARIKDGLSKLKEDLVKTGSSQKLEIITDQSRFIEQSINDVLWSAVIGGLLAMVVLYFFLQNILSTIIISLAIPISVILTFFLMYLSGVSLNIMSLGGLALGVGMLVDNAIVVLESINRYAKKGLPPHKSALTGTSEVGKAVTASTLTTIFVFVPIIFVQGIAGQLFTDQALTVTYSLLASLFVALTLIPMLTSRKYSDMVAEIKSGEELKAPNKSLKILEDCLVFFFKIIKNVILYLGKILKWLLWPIYLVFDMFFTFLIKYYPQNLKWALKHRMLTIFIFIFLLGMTVFSYRFVGTELIPEMSQGELIVDIKLTSGTPIELTDTILQEMRILANKEKTINQIFTNAGTSTQMGVSSNEERENLGQLNISLKEGSSQQTENELMDNLRELWSTIPGLQVKFSRPTYFSFKTPIEIEIKGYNLDVLENSSKILVERMANIPGLTDIKSSLEGGNPEIQISFNREKIASLGTDIGSIAQLIRNQVQGNVATEFARLDRKIDIRVRAKLEQRETLEALRRLLINPTAEVGIPLYSVADILVERGPSEIRRVDQERVALVYANLKDRDLGSVAEDIQKIIDSIQIPRDFSITIGGQNKEMSVSFDSMRFAILLAVFLVYLVMASQFESIIHPFIIMFTIPFGLIGVMVALLILQITISVVVLIGVIMLSGIVVNNAIVLVDYINQLRRDQGFSKMDAIIEACNIRLRPILMTTTTTILGLLPMAIGFGEGSEIRTPMAITVIGGLTIATFLTLILVPTVYSLIEREKRYTKNHLIDSIKTPN